MKRFILFLAMSSFVFIVSGGSSYGIPWTWTDVFDPNPDIYFSAPNNGGVQTYSYAHDIRDEGFDVGNDLVLTYDLSVALYDDSGNDPYEWVYINLPGIVSDQVVEIDFTDVELGMSLLGWVQLNLTGMLDVTLTRITGDFYFGKSTLNAHGWESAPVPEPMTVLLLGLGLLLMGLWGGKRKWKGEIS